MNQKQKARLAGPNRLGSLAPWLLIGVTPVLMALATWDPASLRTVFEDKIRFFGIPAIGVELVVILQATASGLEPLKFLRSIPIWARGALLVLMLIAIGTALFAEFRPLMALIRMELWLVHILFGLSVAHLLMIQGDTARRLLWRSIVAGLCTYLLLVMVLVLVMPHPDRFDWHYFGLGVTNIRHAGFFAATGAAAALGLASIADRHSQAALWTGAASLMFGFSFWSGTRGSILGVWAAFGLGLIVFRKLRSIRAASAIVVSTAAGMIISLVHSVPSQMFGLTRLTRPVNGSTLEAQSSGRLELWAGAWRAIRERPLFGYGEDQFLLAVPESKHLFNHPHNSILQIFFQWGVSGGLCFFALTLLILYRCFQAIRREGEVHLPAFLIVATLLVMSLHDGTLFFTYPMMMIVLCLGSMMTQATYRPTSI